MELVIIVKIHEYDSKEKIQQTLRDAGLAASVSLALQGFPFVGESRIYENHDNTNTVTFRRTE